MGIKLPIAYFAVRMVILSKVFAVTPVIVTAPTKIVIIMPIAHFTKPPIRSDILPACISDEKRSAVFKASPAENAGIKRLLTASIMLLPQTSKTGCSAAAVHAPPPAAIYVSIIG